MCTRRRDALEKLECTDCNFTLQLQLFIEHAQYSKINPRVSLFSVYSVINRPYGENQSGNFSIFNICDYNDNNNSTNSNNKTLLHVINEWERKLKNIRYKYIKKYVVKMKALKGM